ncbi:unnamed protein product [Protopolystoma xenopodis]|uniref:Cyclic nucleotide-binding domain-containing protein n=1 Tax=Protopolystoma xenopodis TaxID=117903 RepID=A0A448WAS9_9PLAT|nr:unnamed protein product [Protopolystoma xenopodis]
MTAMAFENLTKPDSRQSIMFISGPGEFAGLLGLITGEPNIYSLQAVGETLVAVMPREHFYALVRGYPGALFSISHLMTERMSPFLRQVDFALEWLTVKAGRALYKRGEASDNVYVVLNGRLRQINFLSNGERRIVGELGRGDLVGFLEVFSAQPRAHTVIAIR